MSPTPVDEDGGALSVAKKIFDYEMTVAEWLGLAAILAAPYLLVGVIWSIVHAEGQSILWFLSSTLTWPWLMFPTVACLNW